MSKLIYSLNWPYIITYCGHDIPISVVISICSIMYALDFYVCSISHVINTIYIYHCLSISIPLCGYHSICLSNTPGILHEWCGLSVFMMCFIDHCILWQYILDIGAPDNMTDACDLSIGVFNKL